MTAYALKKEKLACPFCNHDRHVVRGHGGIRAGSKRKFSANMGNSVRYLCLRCGQAFQENSRLNGVKA